MLYLYLLTGYLHMKPAPLLLALSSCLKMPVEAIETRVLHFEDDLSELIDENDELGHAFIGCTRRIHAVLGEQGFKPELFEVYFRDKSKRIAVNSGVFLYKGRADLKEGAGLALTEAIEQEVKNGFWFLPIHSDHTGSSVRLTVHSCTPITKMWKRKN